jgi:dihydrofolate reductase
MRRLHVNTFVSLDGVMQAPGGPHEDPTRGFALGGWNVPYWDDVMGEAMGADFGTTYDLLLGRKTYDIFAAHWPHLEDSVAQQLNKMRKYVASRTLTTADWEGTTIMRGDAAKSVAELKHTDGPDLQVQGSSDLIQTLLSHRLIDTFSVWTFPVLLGSGKRLFGEGTKPAGLRVESVTMSTTGVVIAKYELAGDVPLGSFEQDEPAESERLRRAALID